MKLARAIHFDNNDAHSFARAALTGEWCLSGTFEFTERAYASLSPRERYAFANGWLGLDSGGRSSVVSVAWIDNAEIARLVERLAEHFVTHCDMDSVDVARPAAADEMFKMANICEQFGEDTLLTMRRSIGEDGIAEDVHVIQRDDVLTGQLVRSAVMAPSR